MSALLILQVIRMVGESQEAVGAGVGGGSSGTNKMPTLEEYGTNLTRQAEEVSRGLQLGCGMVQDPWLVGQLALRGQQASNGCHWDLWDVFAWRRFLMLMKLAQLG